MNFALGALLVVLLLLPGIAFRFAYIGSNSIRRTLDFSLLSEVVIMLTVALGLHSFGISLLRWLELQPNIRLLYLLGTGGELADSEYDSVADGLVAFTGYTLTLCLLGVIGGYSLQRLAMYRGWDRRHKVFRVYNDWDKYLNGWAGPHRKDKTVAFTRVDLLVDDVDGEDILYSGILEAYTLNSNQTIDQIFLSVAVRRRRSSARDSPEDQQIHKEDIPGDYFVIPFNKIQNLNIIYIPYPEDELPNKLKVWMKNMLRKIFLFRKTSTAWICPAFLLFSVLLSTCDRAQNSSADGLITLSRDSITLTVDPALGGRITSLTYGGREVLQTERDSAGYTFGSTAWTSPQSDWQWPPPATFDSEPYTVQKLEQNYLLLKSAPDSTGLSLQKRYRLGPASDIGLTYWFTYEGEGVRSVAAWEVTRLPYGGYLEFGSDSVRLQKVALNELDTAGGRVRIHFDGRYDEAAKIFASLDSTLPAYHYNGLVLRKETDVRDLYRTAPGQAPLEVYWNPERRFVEFELQGDYRKLRYGETATLRTRWVVDSR